MTDWAPPDLPDLSAADAIGLDTETHDPDLKSKGPGVRRDGYMVGISVAVPDGRSWYLPFGHEGGDNLPKKKVIAWAKKELTRPNQPKVGANLLYDLDYLAEEGVDVAGPFRDVQVAEPLLDENKGGNYSLEDLMVFHDVMDSHGLDGYHEMEAACNAAGWKGAPQTHLWRLPARHVAAYAQVDAIAPLRILARQEELLGAEELLDLFDLECRLIPILLAMRRRGVRVSKKRLLDIDAEMEKRLAKAQRVLDKAAGGEVKPWAARSIAAAFDGAGIPYPTTAKKGEPSFQKKWLENHEHPLAAALLNVRTIDKFKSTFVRGQLLNKIIDGRIHCQFHQSKSDEGGTVTGRFSSSDPNLQFIPLRDPELGPMIRSAFVAEVGERWYRADYSQVELRILAHYARGPGAADIRRRYIDEPDVDFHAMCAEWASIGRKQAKTVNFGIVYGMGIAKTSYELNLSYEEGKGFLNDYHKRLPFLRSTTRAASDVAQGRGYVRTILKRRRRFKEWEPRDWNLSRETGPFSKKEHALAYVREQQKRARQNKEKVPAAGVRRYGTHKAFNAVDQGSAADVMKKAMVDIWESGVCDVTGAPLLTVHDELDFSVPKTKEGTAAMKEAKYLMETTIPFRVPILVDMQKGRHWGECD